MPSSPQTALQFARCTLLSDKQAQRHVLLIQYTKIVTHHKPHRRLGATIMHRDLRAIPQATPHHYRAYGTCTLPRISLLSTRPTATTLPHACLRRQHRRLRHAHRLRLAGSRLRNLDLHHRVLLIGCGPAWGTTYNKPIKYIPMIWSMPRSRGWIGLTRHTWTRNAIKACTHQPARPLSQHTHDCGCS